MFEKTLHAVRFVLTMLMHVRFGARNSVGKITVLAAIGSGVAGMVLGTAVLLEAKIPHVSADDVSTSVTVLNTAPSWTVDAQESPASSTSTPTQSGSAVTWTATATDSSGDNYFLLICKSSTTPPTAVSNAPPTCGGGISNRWAVSATTTSGSQATAATTTKETFPFQQENNEWTAWVCDSNTSLPRCNDAYRRGDGDAASPFVVNHPPVFSSISNNGPANPGGSITWTTTSYDNDTITGSNDTVRLFVCKASDFTGSACGPAGGWATSTLVTTNAATTTIIAIPTQDALYSAFVYVVDARGRTATSTFQGSNSSFTINNVAPTLSAALISLEGTSTGNIILTTPAGTSGPFYVRFTATDNNSCLATVGNEIVSAYTNVYRSGIGQTGCDSLTEYNSNNCYTASSTQFSNYLSCTQDASSCSGTSDSDSTWTCSFPLWFNADPTDGDPGFTPWSSENWKASVSITDDDGLYSPETETAVGNEIASFLAFDVTQTSIAYGGLQPGENSGVFSTTTDLKAQGNIGLDEDLYGDTMCTVWSTADSCDHYYGSALATSTIPVTNQKFATSAVAYASSYAYNLTSSSSPTNLDIRVQKTTATSTLQTKNTHWGIFVPSAVTQAGAYSGQNTLTAKKSPIAFW